MSNTIAKLQSALVAAESSIRDLFTFVRFCEATITLSPIIAKIPQLLDFAFKRGLPGMDAKVRKLLEEDVDTIKNASDERGEYQSYLHGVAVVKACSVLETSVDDVALALLSDRDYWSRLDDLGKLRANKVDLINLLRMNHSQQTAFLLQEIKKEVAAGLKVGAGRYEAILNFVGLGGPVPETASRAMVELLETRHLLVHRNGIVDSKFVNRCPWRRASIDSKLDLGRLDFSMLSCAATWYLLEMQRRASTLFPECTFEHDSSLLNDFLGDISEFDTLRNEAGRPENV